MRFPLGGLTKDVVRQRARALGLVTADKPDSQGICFVGRRGYAEVVARRGGGQAPGEVVHLDGTVLGRHEGVDGTPWASAGAWASPPPSPST